MDTSPTFIKMSDCPEIQGLRYIPGKRDYFDDGDYYFWSLDDPSIAGHGKHGKSGIKIDHDDGWSKDDFPSNSIWLPRQDQLQKMMGISDLWVLTLRFEYFLRTEKTYNIREYPFGFTSMEQLWLAFVMKEKYQKTWNGKEWVKNV